MGYREYVQAARPLYTPIFLHTNRCPARPSEDDRLFSQQTHGYQRPSLYPSGSVMLQFLMDISIDSATLGQLEKHAVVGRPNRANGMRAWVQKLEATQEHSVEDIIDNDFQLPGLQHSSGARTFVIGSNSLDALKTQQIETHRGASYDQRSTEERSVPHTKRPLRRRSGRHDLRHSFDKEDTYDQDRWIDTQILAGSSLENISTAYAAKYNCPAPTTHFLCMRVWGMELRRDKTSNEATRDARRQGNSDTADAANLSGIPRPRRLPGQTSLPSFKSFCEDPGCL